MVNISKKGAQFHFEIQGFHKLWAFKNEIIIPAEHILRAYQNMEELSNWKGWRMPGTQIPGLITAGTYHLDEDKIFWDVVNKEQSIIIELKDEDYKKLIVEVEDVAAALLLLNQ